MHDISVCTGFFYSHMARTLAKKKSDVGSSFSKQCTVAREECMGHTEVSEHGSERQQKGHN